MDFWQVVKKRKSTRSFDPDEDVSPALIDKIIEAGRRAPSAGALYVVDFIVVRDKEMKGRLAWAAVDQNFIIDAPAVIVVIADVEKCALRYGERGRSLYAVQDSAASAENMILAATALGIDTCWVSAFDEREVIRRLKLDPGLRPTILIPIGYKKHKYAY